MNVKILEKSTCYQGFFKLIRYRLKHSLFRGGWSDEVLREVLERGQAVAVLPYDPILEQVVLIEQFRPGAIDYPEGAWLWEIVAGIIEVGEQTERVAYRETEEETGCQLSNIIHINDFFVSPGSTSETTTLFCGKVDASEASGIHGVVAEHEDIKVHVISLDAALDMVTNNKIHFVPAIVALQWLALHREEVKAKWTFG
ncbi:NUDIX domain-containing protein [Candidatus Halobeggiatoa sp. HSG11]|nr:NUDIX domain-containing protein [Candidatus Halobeggiatoa sp. HSG11]